MPWETVPTAGISQLTKIDFEYARILKSTIKVRRASLPISYLSPLTINHFPVPSRLFSSFPLTAPNLQLVGVASLNTDRSLAVFVSPMVVPLVSPLATAKVSPRNSILDKKCQTPTPDPLRGCISSPLSHLSFHSIFSLFLVFARGRVTWSSSTRRT